MSTFPPPGTLIKTVGIRQRCEVGGRSYFRRGDTGPWIDDTSVVARSRPPPPSSSLFLSLVRQKQAVGEPLHWSLFVARENQPGNVYQVKGDAQCMKYKPSNENEPKNIVLSGSFVDILTLAAVTPEQAMVVSQIAKKEPPPEAPNMRSIKENCQDWTWRAIKKLVERGIVSTAKLHEVHGKIGQQA